jgi:hypothetical protein
MNAMFEVLYRRPRDLDRERKISAIVALHGGRLDHFEETDMPAVSQTITLTFVFQNKTEAEIAASKLFSSGHHVEEVCDYPG